MAIGQAERLTEGLPAATRRIEAGVIIAGAGLSFKAFTEYREGRYGSAATLAIAGISGLIFPDKFAAVLNSQVAEAAALTVGSKVRAVVDLTREIVDSFVVSAAGER